MKLSLVVPCYNEEGNVEKFFSETNRVFENRVSDYEFVFVNDGSKDNTLSIFIMTLTKRKMFRLCHSAETSAKKPQSMQVFPRQRVTLSALLMQIYSSVPRLFWKCFRK